MEEQNSNTEMILPEWKNLVTKAQDWEYGEFHSHKEIEQIINIEYGTQRYYNSVGRANITLLIKQKLLVNCQSKGYQVCMPDAYPEQVLSETRKAFKRMKKSVAICDNAPIENMSSDALIKLRYIRDRASSSMMALKQNRTEFNRVLTGKVIVVNKD